MASKIVNKQVLKEFSLKKLAKKKKKGVGTGDGGLISIKQLN